jgi:hypothetical protein
MECILITLERIRPDGGSISSVSMLVERSDFVSESPDELGGVLQIIEPHDTDPLARRSLERYASEMAGRFSEATGTTWSPGQIVHIDGQPLRPR